MATHGAAVPARRTALRIGGPVAAAVGVIVMVGAIGVLSMPGVAAPEQGAVDRAQQAWADRLDGLAARQADATIARQRSDAAYSDRLAAQATALAAQQLAQERAIAAYGERLTRLAAYLVGQGR